MNKTTVEKFHEEIGLLLRKHYKALLSERIKEGIARKKLSTGKKLPCKE